mmetsp:Transcript_13088/g.34940  ORF Transcript_13088/g.34940 Transcript_13088/m.34940 type:complete len:203 (+) Transcript_13088:463-1071(+)
MSQPIKHARLGRIGTVARVSECAALARAWQATSAGPLIHDALSQACTTHHLSPKCSRHQPGCPVHRLAKVVCAPRPGMRSHTVHQTLVDAHAHAHATEDDPACILIQDLPRVLMGLQQFLGPGNCKQCQLKRQRPLQGCTTVRKGGHEGAIKLLALIASNCGQRLTHARVVQVQHVFCHAHVQSTDLSVALNAAEGNRDHGP